jgi:hypothetical protein
LFRVLSLVAIARFVAFGRAILSAQSMLAVSVENALSRIEASIGDVSRRVQTIESTH